MRRRRKDGGAGEPEGDVVVGRNPVLEQIRREPARIRRILLAHGSDAREVIEVAWEAGITIERCDRRALSARTGGVAHQGVVALVAPYEYAEWQSVLDTKPECLLAVDCVTDPRNLGALVRSAEAAGVGAVIIPRDRSAEVTAAASKAAAGATLWMPVVRVSNLVRALEELKRGGYWVVGLDAGADTSLFAFSFPPRCVIAVGSEGEGLRRLTREACDHLVAIPMVGKVRSLNVSVAGAIACFERLRQRHRIDSPSVR